MADPIQTTPTTPVVAPVAPVADVPLSQMFSPAVTPAPATTSPEPVQPAAEPSPVASVTPATSVQPSVFAQQAAEFGIELPATATDAEVFSAMQERMKQLAPLAGYAQSLLPHADAINEFFASKSAAPTAPSSPAPQEFDVEKHFQTHWKAPTLTPAMQTAINSGLVVRDPDTGMMVAKPGYEVMVTPLLADLNAAINGERDAVCEFFAGNPLKKTYDALRDPIQRMVQAEIDQRLAQTRYQDTAIAEINSFEQQNADWLFQQSASGERMMAPQGQQFVGLVKNLSQLWGIAPNPTLMQLCKAALVNPATAAAPAPAPAAPAGKATPAQVSAEKQKSFLENALHSPSGGGANSVQSESGPVAVTQRELEDMFLKEFRALHGTAA